MTKQLLGRILVISAALIMIMNVSFFKQNEWYDMVRWVSFALFVTGLLLIPLYSKSKSSE